MKNSGTFIVRAGSGLHTRLKRAADSSGQSLNNFCIEKLTSFLARRETGMVNSGAEIQRLILKSLPFEIVGIILFGSVARGEATSESDFDLLIVLPSDQEINRNLYREWDKSVAAQASRLVDRVVNPHFVSLPSDIYAVGSLWFEVSLDGVILFDKMGDVSKALSTIRHRIAAGEIARHDSHGQIYWIKYYN